MISTDTAILSVVRESAFGVTPATPAFDKLRFTGEGLKLNPKTIESAEISEDRQTADLALVGADAGGDISVIMARDTAFEMLLESAMSSVWTTDTLKIGTTKYSHTFEKKLSASVYHRVTGAVVDGFSLSVANGGAADVKFSVKAKDFVPATSAIAGCSYTATESYPLMVAPVVSGISIGGVTAYLVGSLSLNYDNGVRMAEALGSFGAVDNALGKAKVKFTAKLYFLDNVLLNALRNQTDVPVSFTLNDGAGNSYAFDITHAKLSVADAPIGGSEQDIMCDISATALKDATNTALKITRTHAA